MKASKKIAVVVLVIALVAVLSVSLVACGNKVNDAQKLVFGKELITPTSQMEVLTQLNNGSADIGVMDSIMAGYYMSTGSYASTMQLIDGLVLAEEEYGIAAKKGNLALVQKINEALIALATNGKMTEIAEEFGIADEVLVDSTTQNPITSATDSSWTNLVASNRLIVGYTEFAPIAFKEAGVLTGYDIELAKEVVSYLNATYSANIVVEFQVITWSQKEAMLEAGSIDLVWNGMTINEERLANMQVTIPYLQNTQVAVIKKANAEAYAFENISQFIKATKNAIVAAENGSAGQDCMVIE